MTVCLIDKRRRGQQIPSVEMPNHSRSKIRGKEIKTYG